MAGLGTISAAILALVVATSHATPVNVLVNSGFESGNSGGWTVSGNTESFGVASDASPIAGVAPWFQPGFVNVRSGNFAAFGLLCCSDATPERVLLTQTVAVPMNAWFNAGFYIGHDSNDHAFGMFLEDSNTEIFVDGVGIRATAAGAKYGHVVIQSGSTESDFTLIRGDFFTGGRTTITVSYAISGSGTAHVGASFDDFFVTQTVPEPSTLNMVGFAGMILIALRSRRTG